MAEFTIPINVLFSQIKKKTIKMEMKKANDLSGGQHQAETTLQA